MRTFLAVDQGNTAVKATVIRVEEGSAQLAERVCEARSFVVAPSDEERLLTMIELEGVDSAAFCSVGRLDVRLVESLRNAVDGNLLLLTHHTPLPIEVEYKGKATLGLDRVAAAAGVACLKPGEASLVVDAGTAVTIDAMDASSHFVGGNIAPGMALRFASLHEATQSLPLVSTEGDCPEFGYDTPTAIRAGVVGGMCREIIASFLEARSRFGCCRLFLTGGDGEVIANNLTTMLRGGFPGLLPEEVEISYQPNLLALGLLSVYNYNETNLNETNL